MRWVNKSRIFFVFFLLVCNSLQYVLLWWKTNIRLSETHARGGERATDALKQPNGGVSNDSPHSVINLVDISIFNTPLSALSTDGCVCTILFSQASCPGGACRSPALVKVLWGVAEFTCRQVDLWCGRGLCHFKILRDFTLFGFSCPLGPLWRFVLQQEPVCTELCSDLSDSWTCGLEGRMSTMSSEGDAGGQPSTTTISTVAVQAGDSQIVVAVLKVF